MCLRVCAASVLYGKTLWYRQQVAERASLDVIYHITDSDGDGFDNVFTLDEGLPPMILKHTVLGTSLPKRTCGVLSHMRGTPVQPPFELNCIITIQHYL